MLKRGGDKKCIGGRKRTAHAEILKVKQNKTMLIYSLYLCSWFAVVFMNIIFRVAFSWLEDRDMAMLIWEIDMGIGQFAFYISTLLCSLVEREYYCRASA